MANEKVNKVVLGNETLIDLTDATASADKILTGYTAYGSDGNKLSGTAGASVVGTKLIIPASMGSVSNNNLSLV